MYFPPAAVALLLADAAYVHAGCLIAPNDTGAVVVPNGWTEIKARAFYECAIKSIIIPKSVLRILDWAFHSSSLEEITFEAGSQLEVIGKRAFWETPIKSIIIPKTVRGIKDYAFYESSLAEIEFEAGSQLEGIYSYAFAFTKKIKSIIIPRLVRGIGFQAFLSSPLEVVEFEAGSQLKKIENGAFAFTKIKNIVIPHGVYSFDGSVFGDTPCEDKNVFKPGNTVVNCEIVKDPCVNLKKRECGHKCVFTKRDSMCHPKKDLHHNCAQYEEKTSCLEIKFCKFPHGKCIHRCEKRNMQRCKRHKFCNLVKVVTPCFGCQLITNCGASR